MSPDGERWPRDGAENMSPENIQCVLLADRHHGITEGIRGLLESMFHAVVMVADENSLLESASRLRPTVAVVELSLARTDSLRWLRQLRACSPISKIIVLSIHDEPSVRRTVLEAGADAFVLKRCVATELLPAIDAVLAAKPATIEPTP
jgi:DNA-binding NarL/FixJ family response regulator